MIDKKAFPWGNLFSWLVLLHSAAFLLFWLTNRFFFADTNDYLAGMLGIDLDYISLCLGFAALLAGWSAVRLLWPAAARLAWQRAGAGVFAILGSFFLAFFYGGFALLFSESPVQVTRLGYLVWYNRLAVDITAWVGLAFLFHKINNRWAAGALLVVIWAAAALFPPGAVYHNLPEKPRLVAHRGAAMIAPENTLAAAEAAVQTRTYALESDVRVSEDGQLFLMHDSTLKRTTNVAEVFPERASDRAETFTRADLDRLDAGQWFFETDPFGTVRGGEVSLDPQQAFPIPTFTDWLEVVHSSGQIFIYDLQTPPENHPYAGQMLDLALAEIRAAGVEGQIWLLLAPEEVAEIKANYPTIWRTAGIGSEPVPAARLVSEGYQIVNAEFNLPLSAAKSYRQAGLWVNLWTVDEPWLYSWLWLNGVDSVTTNNAHTFTKLDAPVTALPYPAYLAFWIVLGLMGAFVALWRR